MAVYNDAMLCRVHIIDVKALGRKKSLIRNVTWLYVKWEDLHKIELTFGIELI